MVSIVSLIADAIEAQSNGTSIVLSSHELVNKSPRDDLDELVTAAITKPVFAIDKRYWTSVRKANRLIHALRK